LHSLLLVVKHEQVAPPTGHLRVLMLEHDPPLLMPLHWQHFRMPEQVPVQVCHEELLQFPGDNWQCPPLTLTFAASAGPTTAPTTTTDATTNTTNQNTPREFFHWDMVHPPFWDEVEAI